MARLIQQEVKQVLAEEILFGKLANGGQVEIDVGDKGLVFRYKRAMSSQPAAVSAEV
ncbi:MAG: hypothetical protein ACRERD_19505 [Candidatus Binatia bacterium]